MLEKLDFFINAPAGVHENLPPANYLPSATTPAAEVRVQPFTTKTPYQFLTAVKNLRMPETDLEVFLPEEFSESDLQHLTENAMLPLHTG